MADTKISALTAAAAAAGANQFAINEGGASKRVDLDQIATYLQTIGMPRVKVLGSDHAISSTTATEVTDLQQTLEAGIYCFDYRLIVQSATTSVGPFFGVNFTGTVDKFNYWLEYADATSALSAGAGPMDNVFGLATGQFGMIMPQNAEHTTTAPTGTTSGVAAADADILCIIRGIVVVTVSGDLELWHKSETATSTTVESGSSAVVIRTG